MNADQFDWDLDPAELFADNGLVSGSIDVNPIIQITNLHLAVKAYYEAIMWHARWLDGKSVHLCAKGPITNRLNAAQRKKFSMERAMTLADRPDGWGEYQRFEIIVGHVGQIDIVIFLNGFITLTRRCDQAGGVNFIDLDEVAAGNWAEVEKQAREFAREAFAMIDRSLVIDEIYDMEPLHALDVWADREGED